MWDVDTRRGGNRPAQELTKRELLAAIAMHAITVQPHFVCSPEECARGAVVRADELLKALRGEE